MSQQNEVKRVTERHKQAILCKPNVVGVGIGHKVRGKRTTDELCITAMVRHKIPRDGLDPDTLVPPEVDGIPTDIIEVGELTAVQAPTDRWRPAIGGVSLGHYQVTAGTLGCVVRDRTTGSRLILSNNHVLANTNAAAPSDPILQPGAADGGLVHEDMIARLERFCRIEFSTAPPVCPLAIGFTKVANALAGMLGSRHRLGVHQAAPAAVNFVDAAVARPLQDGYVLDEILGIGIVDGAVPATLGMTVRKSGRTSGLNTGLVIIVEAMVDIRYSPEHTARFDNQIVTSGMSQGGDSGSLLVAGDSLKTVGLLFAGSPQVTVHNQIQAVLDCLDVTLSRSPSSPLDWRTALARARAVRKAHGNALLSKAHVVGVGTGMRQKAGNPTDTVALVVMVSEKVPRSQLAPEDVIPSEIEGVPVDVQEAGELRAH